MFGVQFIFGYLRLRFLVNQVGVNSILFILKYQFFNYLKAQEFDFLGIPKCHIYNMYCYSMKFNLSGINM